MKVIKNNVKRTAQVKCGICDSLLEIDGNDVYYYGGPALVECPICGRKFDVGGQLAVYLKRVAPRRK